MKRTHSFISQSIIRAFFFLVLCHNSIFSCFLSAFRWKMKNSLLTCVLSVFEFENFKCQNERKLRNNDCQSTLFRYIQNQSRILKKTDALEFRNTKRSFELWISQKHSVKLKNTRKSSKTLRKAHKNFVKPRSTRKSLENLNGSKNALKSLKNLEMPIKAQKHSGTLNNAQNTLKSSEALEKS